MNKFAIFLRGVNVGGKNKIKMEDLRQSLANAGLLNVKTYIQSGNIVVETAMADETEISHKIAEIIKDEFAIDTKILTRSFEELEKLIENNPFAGETDNEKFLHVIFLNQKLNDEQERLLLAAAGPNEKIAFCERTIFCRLEINFSDSIFGKSFIEKKLKVFPTVRNWRTVAKVLSL